MEKKEKIKPKTRITVFLFTKQHSFRLVQFESINRQINEYS